MLHIVLDPKSLLSFLQLLNRELREAKSAKMETHVEPDVQKSTKDTSAQHHLPQNPTDTPASEQTASSASPATPTESATPSASPVVTKLQLGETDSSNTKNGLCS